MRIREVALLALVVCAACHDEPTAPDVNQARVRNTLPSYRSLTLEGDVTCVIGPTTVSDGTHSYDQVVPWCWGLNSEGQVGDGATSGNIHTTPVAVITTINSSMEWLSVSAGYTTTCGVIAAAGSSRTPAGAACWGRNGEGALGIGSVPPLGVAFATFPQSITSERIVEVSANRAHVCGVAVTAKQSSKGVYCWGWDAWGQAGQGVDPYEAYSYPFPVVNGASLSHPTAGGHFSCALKGTEAWCWGENDTGQLGAPSTDTCGDGTITGPCSRTPLAVTGGHSFVQIEAGYKHACGVTKKGEAYCWGLNAYGQLGNGTAVNSAVPQLVGGGLKFSAVSAGVWHTCGLTTTKQAYCWGLNTDGRLGNGTPTFSELAPVPVSGGRTWTEVVAGGPNSCGISGGRVYCWGGNDFGGLGNGTTTPSAVPIQASLP
jgi:alpha-tubulin suppressor-like RCC1 family protein